MQEIKNHMKMKASNKFEIKSPMLYIDNFKPILQSAHRVLTN